MMRRKLISLILMSTITCCLFSGCGKTDNGGAQTEQKESSVSEAAPETSTPKDNSDEKELTENEPAKTSEAAPALLLNRASRIEWNDENKPIIYHYYSYLTLEKEYAASHSMLADNLDKARADIEAREYDNYMVSLEEAKEFEGSAFECSWYTYLRRCDGKYISFVNQCRNSGTFDFDAISYLARTYSVDSGKEIELSDIVSDEDAFFDLLAAKLKEKVDEDMNDYMGEPSNLDLDGFKDRIKKSLDFEDGSWTLDPQGISFWFDSNVFSLFSASATVFFSEDKDGKIFKEELVKDIPDEWIMQMPDADITYFDEDDDGGVNEVMAFETNDFDADGEHFYISGFGINYEDESPRYKQEEVGTYDFFLMHKDHKNLILESHYEYEDGLISTYLLENGKVKDGEKIWAALEYSWDEAGAAQEYAPCYLPTNMDNIRVLIDEGTEAHDMTSDILSVSIDGKMKLASGRTDALGTGGDSGASSNTPDPLKGLVSDDILNAFRASNNVKSISIYEEGKNLGSWIQKTIGKDVGEDIQNEGDNIGRSYEFWFGTDVGNNFESNFPIIYGTYYSLKDYYETNGMRSVEFYEGVQEENEFLGSGNPDNIANMFYDLRNFVTDCNNVVRDKEGIEDVGR
jgi:hypothetical protein